MKYTLMFLDTETTGALPEDRVTQVAYKFWKEDLDKAVDEMFKPPLPVKIEAMEVTHITNRMLENKPPFVGSETQTGLQKLFESEEMVMVAHNAPFDVGMLEKDDVSPKSVIDTLKIARHLDPGAAISSYRLQYLRYLLDLDADIDVPIQAHDAKGDIIVLEKLFDRLFEKMKKDFDSDDAIIEEMIRVSKLPSEFKRINFGKYRGEKISDIAEKDVGYLQWLYKQKKNSEEDETDWIYTLEKYLK